MATDGKADEWKVTGVTSGGGPDLTCCIKALVTSESAV